MRAPPRVAYLNAYLPPRQVDDHDVMSTRRIAGKRGTAACFGIVRISTNTHDVQLTRRSWCAVRESGRKWSGDGK
jgi:hypothetical protein